MGALSMTKTERETFLAGLHVGVLAIAGADGESPVLAPIWYGYEPGGDVRMLIDAAGRKAERLRATGRASLCAQNEALPYQYVTVQGPVTLVAGLDEDERSAIAHRYLGPELAPVYLAATGHRGGEGLTASLTPERWLTVDYAKETWD
jgi:nitroimidazol reductase NimA-like FMN-containing flavoprotein (pyridoxamine 5'-phosphate oxidase superfamily)